MATHSSGNPLLPGKSHGPRNLVVYSPWGCKELGTAEPLHCLSVCLMARYTDPVSNKHSHGARKCHLIMIGEGDEHCLPLMDGLTNTN